MSIPIEKIITRLEQLQAASQALACEAEELRELIKSETKKPVSKVRQRILQKYYSK